MRLDDSITSIREYHSPHTLFGIISSSVSGVEWPSFLVDWMKRASVTLNGAKKTATIDDDGTSYADQTAYDATWTTSDTAKVRGNPTDDDIDFTFRRLASDVDSISRDLTSVSDDYWSWRTKIDVTTVNSDTAIVCHLSSTQNADTDSNADRLGVALYAESSANYSLYLVESDGAGFTWGTGQDTGIAKATDVYYFEIKKDGTKLTGTLYADSDYSEVLFSYTWTVSADITGLRYLTYQNYNGNTGSLDIIGTLDDIEFYNNESVVQNISGQQTATHDFDFTSDSGWTPQDDTKIDVNTGNGRLEFVNAMDSTNDAISYNMTALSNERWTIQFDITYETLVEAANTSFYIGMSDTNSASSCTANRDFIGFRVDYFSGAHRYSTYDLDGQAMSATGTDTTGTNDTVTTTTHYVTIVRLSATTYRVDIHSDSARTVLVDSISGTCASSVQSLDEFGIWNRCNVSNSGELNGYIDNLKIFDNITEVNPTHLINEYHTIKILGDSDLQRRTTPTREDLFTDSGATSHSSSPSTVGGWLAQDHTKNLVNGTLDRMDINLDNDSTNDAISYDLGSTVSDSKFRIDVDFVFTNFITNGNLAFGLSSNDSSNGNNSTQDFLGMGIDKVSTGNLRVRGLDTDGAVIDMWSNAGDDPKTFAIDDNGITLYATILRLSTTSYRIELYKDKARTILWQEFDGTCASTTQSLQHIKLMNIDNVTTAGELSGYISRVVVWSGITNPIDQETATFEDDGTSYADQTAYDNAWTTSDTAKARGNPTDDDIDFTFRRLASDVDSISYDLQDVLGSGKFADNKKWTWRSKINVTSYGIDTTILMHLSSTQNADTDTSADRLGLQFYFESGANTSFYEIDTDGAAYTIGSSSDTGQAKATGNHYFEIIRDENDLKITWYSDSDYSIVVYSTTYTISGDPQNLRYLTFQNYNGNTGSLDLVGIIDDVSFWDGISSPNATARKFVITDNITSDSAIQYATRTKMYDPINGDLELDVRVPSLTTGIDTTLLMYYDYQPASNPSYVPEEMPLSTATYDDDFSVDNGWDVTDTNVSFDVANDEIDLTSTSSSFDIAFLDLQDSDVFGSGNNLHDKNFVIRAEIYRDSDPADTTNGDEIQLGVSDATTDGWSNAQDSIGFRCQVSKTGTNQYSAFSTDGQFTHQGDAPAKAITDWGAGVTWYFEIKCDGNNLHVNVYTNSDYETGLVETSSVTHASPTGMRYLFLRNFSDSARSGSVFSLRRVQIWNDTQTHRERATYDSNYKAIYDLNGNSLDSTVYGNDGTETSVDWEEQNNDVGLVADGSNTKIDVGSDSSIDDLLHDGHLEFTINPKSDGEGSVGAVIYKRSGGLGGYVNVEGESGGFMKLNMYVGFDSTDGRWRTTNAVIPIGEVTECVIDYNPDSVTNDPVIIINGIKYTVGNGLDEVQTPVGTKESDAATSLVIGNEPSQASTFDGYIGYVGLSDKQRSSLVAITRYNSRKANSDFVTVGTEETQ
ncbi:hypothetical protein [Nitrosopumilus sp.]|uniref:hypothetical protein n=1 Tax=Nitrosopumilus sp. TaxID=2024843 RepID=UPI003D109EEE